MHTIELDAHTEQALSRLAAIAGREPDQIIKDVLSHYLEEQADAAYSRYLAGQEKALSLDEVDYLPHLGRTGKDNTGSLSTTGILPSLKGFRQGLPLQSISAGEFCRSMREGERY